MMTAHLLLSRHRISIITALLACTILSLNGCTAMTAPKVEQPLDDKTVAASIKDKIASEPDLGLLKIDVRVKQGDVVLSGIVPSRKIEIKLIKLVLGTPGVKSVKDNITVKEKQP